ncbi:CpaF/VirB11 family protein [Vibrio aestuarianus]|nr:CpaF/VirB11 family protein [Vibrio aestuarianus]
MDSPTTEFRILLCGLPSSGKTTFLGALSYLAIHDEIDKDMKFIGLPEHRSFFNKLSEQWLSCEEMSRTLVSSQDIIEIKLEKEKDIYSLELPDLSGETWSELWASHELTTNLESYLTSADGVVFFIHSNEIKAPMSIVDEQAIVGHQPQDKSPLIEEWDAIEHPSTQAIVVDLLRKASLDISSSKRLALVLSAWDTQNENPNVFVEREMPLLYQYLRAGFDYENYQIFGVSAQGGCLKTEESKQSLLSEDEPSNRVKVTVDGVNYHSDLTAVLSWVVDR